MVGDLEYVSPNLDDCNLIMSLVLDVADPARPNSWTFQLTSSRVESASHDVSGLADNNDQLAALKAMAENFADPFRSAYRWISEDTVVRTEKVSYWEPIRWNNRKGLVTLAGDAAHPMTIRKVSFRRLLLRWY